MTTWIPVLADWLIGKDRRGNAHAVRAEWGRDQPIQPEGVTACGKRARLMAVRVVRPDGKRDGNMVLSWPPRARLWAERERGVRCQPCYAETGRPRPTPSYDTLKSRIRGSAS